MCFMLIGTQYYFPSPTHFIRKFFFYFNLILFFESCWHAGIGPVKDLYTIGDNPQFSFEINNSLYGQASVWILLTRHITEKVNFIL